MPRKMQMERGYSTVSSVSGHSSFSGHSSVSRGATSVSSLSRATSLASFKSGVSRMVNKEQIMEEANKAVRKGLDSRVTSMLGDRSILATPQEEEEPLTGEQILEKATTGPGLSNLIRFTAATVNKSVRTQGCDKHMLLKVVLEDEWQYRTCTALPLTVFFFVLFVVWVQLHYGTAYINLQENSLRDRVANAAIGANWDSGFGDVNGDVKDTAQLFDWLNNTYFPFMWDTKNNPYATADGRADSARMQSLVAGIVLHTARGPAENCTNAVNQGQPCFPDGSRDYDGDGVFNGWMDTTARRLGHYDLSGLEDWEELGEEAALEGHAHSEGRQLNQVLVEELMTLPEPMLSKISYRKVIPMSMPLQDVRRLLAKWAGRDTPLIKKQTTLFAVEAFLRNERMGPGLITNFRVNFLFPRGGNINTQVFLQTNILKTGISAILVIAAWIFLLVIFTIFTPLRALAAAKHGVGCSHMLRPTNLFDWVLVIIGWVIAIMWLMERASMSSHQEEWKRYQSSRLSTDPTTISDFDKSWLLHMYDTMKIMGKVDQNLVALVSYYHIVLLFRFLVASRGHPRLAIVVNTMNSGMIDLFHLFLVFSIVFAAYTVSGHILMGRRLDWYATIQGSIGYNLSIIFMRQYDWSPISAKDWFTVGVWTWTFLLLEVQVVVNIVLAMIFDNYGEVRVHVTDKDTLWHTTRRLITQLRLLSTWVSNHDLLIALTKASNKSSTINAEKLRQMLPGISNEQLSHLFDSAKLRLFTTVTKSNKNMLPEAVASILLAVDSMRQGVRLMMQPNAVVETPEPGSGGIRPTIINSSILYMEEEADDEARGVSSEYSKSKEKLHSSGLLVDEPENEPDEPGRYMVTHDNTLLRVDIDVNSEVKQKLKFGTIVNILEVQVWGEGELKRIRGKVQEPAGWMSLKDLYTEHRFADRVQTQKDEPGKYIISHKNSAVRESIELTSTIVQHLESGTVVRVLEIQMWGEGDQQRLRGKLEQPNGWISILDPVSDYRFADKIPEKEKPLPDEAPAWFDSGLKEHLERQQLLMGRMFWQMKKMEEELAKRGFGVEDCDFPEPLRVKAPEADPSLDPSFAGEVSLGPGQGRHRLITHMPRKGQAQSQNGLATRLQKLPKASGWD